MLTRFLGRDMLGQCPVKEIPRDEKRHPPASLDPFVRRTSALGLGPGIQPPRARPHEGLHRRRRPPRGELLPPVQLRDHQAQDAGRDRLPALSHLRRGQRLPEPVGQGLPEPRRPLFGRQELRRPRHLADHDHQQGHRQGHGQAGDVRRGQPPLGRGDRGRMRPLDRLARPVPLRQGSRDHQARRHEDPLPQAQEQPRRLRPLSPDRPVQPEHGPALRRRRRRPARRGPARGHRRRRLHPPDAEKGRARARGR